MAIVFKAEGLDDGLADSLRAYFRTFVEDHQVPDWTLTLLPGRSLGQRALWLESTAPDGESDERIEILDQDIGETIRKFLEQHYFQWTHRNGKPNQ